MEVQNLEEGIKMMHLNLPIDLTEEQEAKLQEMVSAVKNIVEDFIETREKTNILALLKEKMPLNQLIAIVVSHLSTSHNNNSTSFVTPKTVIEEWLQGNGMDEEWDMMSDAERMLAEQKYSEHRKMTEEMEKLCEKGQELERKMDLELEKLWGGHIYTDAEYSAFMALSSEIDDYGVRREELEVLRQVLEESKNDANEPFFLE